MGESTIDALTPFYERELIVDEPRVVKSGKKGTVYPGAVLMEYIGDIDQAAPALKQVELSPEEARPLLLRVLDNVELCLRNNCIHGDLSAFNILYWRGNVTIIDFPQAIDPRFNPSAREFLLRDLANIYAHWSRYGMRIDPGPYGNDLWQRFLRADP